MRLAPDVPQDVSPHEVFVRAARHDVVSYIKVLEGVLLKWPYLIEKIIVGPGNDRARRCESIREYLRMCHFNIAVATSEIPYLPH
jgi:hypothetical protein